MFRRIWTVALLLATAGPVAGISRATTTANTTGIINLPTPERQAKRPPTKDHAARILVTFSAIYFATLLLLIFRA